MMEFTPDDFLRLSDNDVDAGVPYPMPYEPSIYAHHERYIKKDDWDGCVDEGTEPAFHVWSSVDILAFRYHPISSLISSGITAIILFLFLSSI